MLLTQKINKHYGAYTFELIEVYNNSRLSIIGFKKTPLALLYCEQINNDTNEDLLSCSDPISKVLLDRKLRIEKATLNSFRVVLTKQIKKWLAVDINDTLGYLYQLSAFKNDKNLYSAKILEIYTPEFIAVNPNEFSNREFELLELDQIIPNFKSEFTC